MTDFWHRVELLLHLWFDKCGKNQVPAWKSNTEDRTVTHKEASKSARKTSEKTAVAHKHRYNTRHAATTTPTAVIVTTSTSNHPSPPVHCFRSTDYSDTTSQPTTTTFPKAPTILKATLTYETVLSWLSRSDNAYLLSCARGSLPQLVDISNTSTVAVNDDKGSLINEWEKNEGYKNILVHIVLVALGGWKLSSCKQLLECSTCAGHVNVSSIYSLASTHGGDADTDSLIVPFLTGHRAHCPWVTRPSARSPSGGLDKVTSNAVANVQDCCGWQYILKLTHSPSVEDVPVSDLEVSQQYMRLSKML